MRYTQKNNCKNLLFIRSSRELHMSFNLLEFLKFLYLLFEFRK